MTRSLPLALKWILLLAVSVLLVPCCYGIIFEAVVLRNYATRPKWHEITTPVPPTVVQDVCQKLNLPGDRRLCRPGAVVYAPELFPFIKRAFTPGVTTYEEIEQALGQYRYHCEEPVTYPGLGLTLFRCWYDFNQDHVFPFVFSFTDDGVLETIFADPYGD
jgi:hypothetical protein